MSWQPEWGFHNRNNGTKLLRNHRKRHAALFAAVKRRLIEDEDDEHEAKLRGARLSASYRALKRTTI